MWLTDKIQKVVNPVYQKIAETVIRIKEAITKKILLSVVKREHLSKCTVRYVNRATNTVTLQDLETRTWKTVQGSSVSKEVKRDMVIYT